MMDQMGAIRRSTTNVLEPERLVDDGRARSVQVWFCGHLIIENTLPKAEADWFESAMCRQWMACQVLNERVPARQVGNQ